MKNYDEQTQSIRAKLSAKRRQRRRAITATISIVCCLVLIVGVFLMIPNDDPIAPETLQGAPTTPPTDIKPLGRDYTMLVNVLKQMNATNEDDYVYGDMVPPADVPEMGLPEATPDDGPSYEGDTEITDNQVAGVTEADIIKRNDKYIFYMNGQSLQVYSIAGADSKQVGMYPLVKDIEWTEMFLSADGNTVTVLGSSWTNCGRFVDVLNLNVKDPADIQEVGQIILTGHYESARFTEGYLYLFTRHYIPGSCDLEKPETFLPLYGTPEYMDGLLMDDIVICEGAKYPVYTVVSRLNPVTLEMNDTLALLGYDGELYVSQENLYLTRHLGDRQINGNIISFRNMTQISRIGIAGEKLEVTGMAQVEGTILNQYSMDEHEEIFRVVTTVDGYSTIERSHGALTSVEIIDRYINASLYCIDFDNSKIIASVERFAPEGERVQSVRFEGDKAYVCTSIRLSDPVFCFDLSDLSNITWKDTGTIDGFSSSLVNIGNSFLLGIGRGSEWDTVKIEVYQEGQTTMDPYCSYEVCGAYISSNYKAYYIDRENQLIGLGIAIAHDEYHTGYSTMYLLLHFDGTQLVQKVWSPLSAAVDDMRAVYIDGWLYMFGLEFKLEQVH